jgi:hypothetical protein
MMRLGPRRRAAQNRAAREFRAMRAHLADRLRLLAWFGWCAIAAAAQSPPVKTGSPAPDVAFTTLQNHDGRTSLAEYRGALVLLQYFGHRSEPCRARAVPLALDLRRRFGAQGLECFLLELQGASREALHGYVLHRFPGCTAILGSERLFYSQSQTESIPHSVLIGVDGVILMEGPTETVGRKLEDVIAREIGKAKNGWGKSPEIVKARALLHGKGKLTEAARALAAAKATIKPAAAEDLAAAEAELELKHARIRGILEGLQEEGRFLEARERASAYRRAVAGDLRREKEAEEYLAAFEREIGVKELKLDAALAKLTAPFRERAPSPEATAALAKFAEQNAGTAVGRRAKRWATAAQNRTP